ncbi:NAD(P)H-hydrate dehydratase [bacterium]|nr:NAD(P)H-hydrate dehydratase [bacterium]
MSRCLPVLSAAQMRELDRHTIEVCGISGRELMGNAAAAVLEQLGLEYPWRSRLLILCGPGNNGGDGLALALLARQAGQEADVLLADPRGEAAYAPGSDPHYYLQEARSAGLRIEQSGLSAALERLRPEHNNLLLVDALFGTGLDRELSPQYAELLATLNQASRELEIPLIALDIPSGLSADSGLPLGAAVQAGLTVSFGHAKLGFYHPGAQRYCGQVEVADIGLSRDYAADPPWSSFDCGGQLPLAALRRRRPDTHKGDYGKVLIIAGHRRYPGAPRLAAEGCARMGAGLIRLVVPDPIYSVSCSNPGIMVDGHPEDGFGGFAAAPSSALLEYLDWADSVVLGPGLGSGEAGQVLVKKLLGLAKQPVVLDADALRALPCQQASEALVLTPHAGELARLLGVSTEELLPRWFELSREASSRFNALVLAKSNQCALAAPDGTLRFPRRGHPAMAVGGSGDVLAGMIGALLAQRRDYGSIEEAVCAAVNMHSAAARLYAQRRGETGMSPLELARFVPRAIQAEREARWELRL